MTLSRRLYRTLLCLYPAEFRHEYGGEMETVFGDRLAAARGAAGRARVCLESLWDMARSAPAEHWDAVRGDVIHGVRSLGRSRSFTAAVAAALAAGIGVNTAVFSVVYAILLKPLPYPNPDRLALVTTHVPHRPLGASLGPDFASWKAQSRSLESAAAYSTSDRMLTGPGGPEPVNAAGVTSELLEILGVRPMMGRGFTETDMAPGAPATALISHAAWNSRFGGAPDVLDLSVHLDAEPLRIIGVLPPGFSFPGETEIWYANREDLAAQRSQGRITIVNVIGRLRPSVTQASAANELTAIARAGWNGPGVTPGYKEMVEGLRAEVTPLSEALTENARPLLLLLTGAVALVLAIACVNAANLLVARAATRRREIAVRLALGAGRSRLVRQTLTESLLLAGGAGVLGTALAFALLRWMVALGGAAFPRAAEIGVNGPALAFTAAVCGLTGMAFGLAPAFFVTRTRIQSALKDGARGGGDPAWPRLRSALVAAQLALALVLLVGAGLLLRSLNTLRQVNPGFDARNLLVAQVNLTDPAYETRERSFAFHQEALRRLRAVPGVVAVGVNRNLPIDTSFGNQMALMVEGHPYDPKLPLFGSRHVNADYFRALGIPVLAGRVFTEAEMKPDSKLVVVNATLARQYFTVEEAVGKRLKGLSDNAEWITIIGVIGDVKHRGLHAAPGPEIYQPYAAVPLPKAGYAVRTKGDPVAMIDSVRSAVRSVDASAGVHSFTTMDRRIYGTLDQRRFQTLALLTFAALAAGLAGVGVYGVVSYAVSQRHHEMGVRMALGAVPGDIVTLVMRGTLRMAAAGLVAGLAVSWLAGRAMSGLLFAVGPGDPLAIAGAAAMLLVVAAAGSFGPALRAARLDPVQTLRRE
ncbi:MAG: ABC transporter permease [Bryobacteraceae bacterium]|nr:ABC transporter permease [Bryobacteraceae bacterium]